MQTNISHNLALSIRSVTGQITQVRNHVKMYPWRRTRNARECYLDPTRTPYTDRHNVNEFVREVPKKDWQNVIPKDKDNRFNAYQWNELYQSDPKAAKNTANRRLQSLKDSLESRGHAREQRPYMPPPNVRETVLSLLTSIDKSIEDVDSLDLNLRREVKVQLLTACIKEFDHHVPNSYLNDMKSISDLIEYFETPVHGVNPYDLMTRQEDSLPSNLHIIPEPIRYNKESDTMFKGNSALPGIISKVPGLRASRKYEILNQEEFQWPDV